MKRGSALTFLVIIMILSLAIIGSLASESEEGGTLKVGPTLPLVYRPLPRIASGSIMSQWMLNSSTRLTIFNYISGNPGVHFRGICSGLGLPVGVVQYHLNRLTSYGLLTSRKDRRYRRYFEARIFSEEEMKVISTLRSETARRAVSIILESPRISHGVLAATLGVSSQGLTWLMRRLKEEGAVGVESDCRFMRYTINAEYRETLVDCLGIVA
jgi:predicted transcriptional regulator